MSNRNHNYQTQLFTQRQILRQDIRVNLVKTYWWLIVQSAGFSILEFHKYEIL